MENRELIPVAQNGSVIADTPLAGNNAMLRITVLEEMTRVTLKLEGRLAGLWVREMEIAWRSTQPESAGRQLVVDLKGVDRVDQAGAYLLALLYQQGTRFVASGTVMTELVRSIAQEWRQNVNPSIESNSPPR